MKLRASLRTLLQRARRARAARPRDFAGVSRAGVCLLRVAASLRRDPFPRTLERFGLNDELPPAQPEAVADAERWVRWSHAVVPLARNCLRDALAAAVLLRQSGCRSDLVIGVARDGGEIRAHAWLGADSSAGHGYEVLWRSPSASR